MADDYQQFVDAGAEVVAVVKDSVDHAREYSTRENLPFPCLADPGHRVYERYGVASTALSLGQRPGLFIIDREGIVRYTHVGRQQWEIPRNADVLKTCRSLPCLIPA